jgi:hypothetical protein
MENVCRRPGVVRVRVLAGQPGDKWQSMHQLSRDCLGSLRGTIPWILGHVFMWGEEPPLPSWRSANFRSGLRSSSRWKCPHEQLSSKTPPADSHLNVSSCRGWITAAGVIRRSLSLPIVQRWVIRHPDAIVNVAVPYQGRASI